ncbi:MAG: cysteate synthase, partial [Rikenellaceae bacterium]|nr:cysteate synthase [Rikenellaceae bacterium]
MKDFKPTQYRLLNVCDGQEFTDAGWTLEKPNCPTPSLVRAVYEKRQIDVKPADWGIYRFADWLPVQRMLHGSAAPMTYKSLGLAAHLGLEHLYITFNGYFPEKNCYMTTSSFKETEAYSVCGRMAAD